MFQNLIGLEERRKQIQKIQTNIRRSRYNPEEVGGLHHFHVFPSVLDACVTVQEVHKHCRERDEANASDAV